MDNKKIGNVLAQAFCLTVGLCLMAITIALTVKLILWIF
jgi:hypothetical protein